MMDTARAASTAASAAASVLHRCCLELLRLPQIASRRQDSDFLIGNGAPMAGVLKAPV